VGEVTTLPVRSMLPGKRSADRFERHRSTFEESIAYLRTSLLLSDELRELQVLAVASAISREGKSSLASQLAVSLANATGETTLLIDTDMRDPDVHEMFGLPLEPGLAEVLEHQVTLDDAIVTSWSRSVHILTAGRLMRSPHVLLGSGAFHTLLDEARARYRYIVIDSPPVLAASEALVVAKAADGTLLCTMRDISRVGQVRQATERLRAAGARPLGAVFSGVPPTNYAYKYGGYYNNAYARRTWKGNVTAAETMAEATDDDPPA
jgi:capsular exopolysaccharide synthesis family protein